ncbi:nucleotidyltransferase family protein [Brucella sp. BE17]|uniref:nucleotidyltransferase family protein n=1 Tax=Brucella sp. BE17 TaxID=3142977 RepID=UPI0031BA8954
MNRSVIADVKIEAMVLAAGSSRRMGAANKLMAHFEDATLISRITKRALASKANTVSVVLGHQAAQLTAILAPLAITTIYNADHASGMASSLKAGIENLAPDTAGVLIVLGDMPAIEIDHINRLIDRFRDADGKAIIRATSNGERGNPVILPRSLFAAVSNLKGDVGARRLIEESVLEILDVEIGPAALIDVDTPEALIKAGGVLPTSADQG